MSHRPPTLKRRLTIGLFGLCVAPILALCLYANGVVSRYAHDNAGIDLQNSSGRIARQLDLGLYERWRSIALVATLINAQGALTQADAFRLQIEALQRDFPIYAWIGIADTGGRVLVSTKRILEQADVSARPWFRAGIQAPFAGDVHEAVMLAQKLPPNANGEPLRFVDIAMPLVRGDGVPMGTLGAHLSWSWVEEVTRSVLDQNGRPSAGTDAMVLSRDGLVLMGPAGLQGTVVDLASVRAGRQGVAASQVEAWPDGGEYVTAVVPTRGEGDYHGIGWLVLVRQPADLALSAVSDLRHRILLAGLAAALLACAVGWTLAGRITRPLDAITRAAERLGHGDLSAPVPPTRAFAEAVTLSAGLVRIAAALAAHRETAERDTVDEPVR
ncbi:HAMP domain-containing protein [Azospirillum sp. TSO35-2]|uniref:cache domain-containing protein n=1 Tax=Azospirillum sp. TSO35-2 TaxID=716796 RepID=UPI001FFE67CD|nr:HAMP domain-containing protein [Azospirillum sp. TSO35-2]